MNTAFFFIRTDDFAWVPRIPGPIFGDLDTYYTDRVMQLETMLNALFLIIKNQVGKENTIAILRYVHLSFIAHVMDSKV